MSKTIAVFLAYAPEDAEWAAQLRKHLHALEESRHIRVWDESLIQPGEDITEQRQEQLLKADAVVLLLSADFMASHTGEATRQLALKQHGSKGTLLIPVYLRPCMLDASWGKFRIVPENRQAIVSDHWSNPDEALLQVSNDLKEELTTASERRWRRVLRRNSLWGLGLLYALVAGMLWWLFVSPVHALKITSARLSASRVEFDVWQSPAGPLLTNQRLQEMGVSHFRQIRLQAREIWVSTIWDEARDEPVGWEKLPASGLTVSPRLAEASAVLAPVTLKSLRATLPAHTVLALPETDGNALQWLKTGIDEQEGYPEAFLSFGDTLRLTLNNCRVDSLGNPALQQASAELLLVHPGEADGAAVTGNSQGFGLDLLFENGIDIREANLQIRKIRCLQDIPGSPVSSILSGSVFLSEAAERRNTPDIQLGEGDCLALAEDGDNLSLSSIRIAPGGLELRVAGRVRNLETGKDFDHLQSRLPSRLDWLLHNKLTEFILSLLLLAGFSAMLYFKRIRIR